MYPSSNDADDNPQTTEEKTSPVTTVPSQSLSPSCPTLLVIDDNSNSNESSVNTTDIPSNSIPPSAQGNNISETQSSPTPTTDAANDTPDQQRRRNSSIAKLLGGQPLKNPQYKEIRQQILHDQSAQNGTANNDNETDSGIQRSRSSITRTLLMNAERNNNNISAISTKGPSSPEFSKNFEYLIRRELDIEHAPSALHSNSATNVFQNLSSVRNTPPPNILSPSQSKFKRKRPRPKQTIPEPSPNRSSNSAPFTMRDPFELDSSAPSLAPPLNPTHIQHPHYYQDNRFLFDFLPHQQHHPPPHPHHQQYSPPMNSSTPGSYPYPSHKYNLNSPVYAHFKFHHDRLSSTPSMSSSLSHNSGHYSSTTELALPSPVSPISLHAPPSSIVSPWSIGGSTCKTKAMYRADMYDMPVQHSCSTIPNQSNALTASSASPSAPLKKRLLNAYKNEQRPSSTL